MTQRLLSATVAVLSLIVPVSAHAQNITEWSSETRTSVAFRVNAEALRKLLPPGWEW